MKLQDIDFRKCLNELEKNDWGKAPNQSTGMIQKIHELRKEPLMHWTNEDYRLMILQQISLEYLVPIVLYRLTKNHFNSGELYIGDLLYAVVRIDEEFWKKHDDLHCELDTIVDSLRGDLDSLNEIISKYKYSYE